MCLETRHGTSGEVGTTRSVSDFKAVTAFRLTASLEYQEVGPAGEIQHGTLDQESYTLQARIEDDGEKLLYINDTVIPVITADAPTEDVEIPVIHAQDVTLDSETVVPGESAVPMESIAP